MIGDDGIQAYDAANPMLPYTISKTASQRRPGVSYVSGLTLTPFERMCCRGGRCWVVTQDPAARHGWLLMLHSSTGYWFHAPPRIC